MCEPQTVTRLAFGHSAMAYLAYRGTPEAYL
jgi:hypothetical protein